MSLRRAIQTHRPGCWSEEKAIGTVTLPLDRRHRRRFRMTDDDDRPFMLDLPEAVLLEDGDGLELEDGGIIRVTAAAEPVCDVSGATPAHTTRLAWHIGNRHTPVQVVDECTLRILEDHVLVAMLEGLGATISRRTAPFTPEPGAYAKQGNGIGDRHGHGHEHGHGHGNGHDH